MDFWVGPADLERAAAQIAWLEAYGSLVSTLDTSFLWLKASHITAATAVLASSLNAAATEPPGLYLQDVSCTAADSNLASLLLQQLPANHLTTLGLEIITVRPGDARSSGTGRPQFQCAKSLGRALAGLTNLRSLHLKRMRLSRSKKGQVVADQNALEAHVLAALSSLTALTNLDLEPCSKQHLSHLQKLINLESLTLPAALHFPGTPVQLGQLTALTSLTFAEVCLPRPVASPLVLEADDELPPNLLELFIADCSSTQPLQGLAQLTYLEVSAAASMSWLPYLLQHLPSLQQLRVTYAAAPGQVAVPAPTAAMPSILSGGVVHGLRSLDISNLPDSAAMVAAAKVVQQLTGLETLLLLGKQQAAPGAHGPAQYEPAAVHQLVAAAAKLPQLQDLEMLSIALDSLAAKLLAAAVSTSLRTLRLHRAKLTDINLCTICCGLTQLVMLDVMQHEGLVIQGLLPFMVKFMPRLTHLHCDTVLADNESSAYSCELMGLSKSSA